MDPLVSILIPCHNAAPWLAETLDSVLAQTWPNKEIIVVDDGSKDDSAAVARRFASRGVSLLEQPNRGASAARNAAMDASHGHWIQFLDADDLLAPDKIAYQMKLAASAGAEFAFCAQWSRFTRSVTDARSVAEPLCCDSDPIDWMIIKLADGAMMHPAAWLISRPLLQRAGRWNEALSLDDDGEFFTRVVLASRGVRQCPDARSYYRSNICGSLSTRRSEAAWRSAFRSQQLCAEHLIRAESSARTRQACADLFQRLAYAAYADAPGLARESEQLAYYYGGSSRPPTGGRVFRGAAKVLGWKLAVRLRHWTESSAK